jgi:hypothetical protein
VSCVQGKSQVLPSPSSAKPPPPVGTVIYIDVFFIPKNGDGKRPVLAAVEGNTRMGATLGVDSMDAKHYYERMKDMVTKYNLEGNTKVKTIVVDGESGLKACEYPLMEQGIKLIVVPTQRHVKIAERFIQEIKSYARSVVSGLGYKLPKSWYLLLIQDITLTRNVVVHKFSEKSPRELFTGLKFNVEEDLKYSFGQVGHTRRMRKTYNDLESRTELAVIVGHYLGEKCFKMVLVRSGRIVKRKEFYPIVPTQQDIQAIQATTGEPYFEDSMDGDDEVELDSMPKLVSFENGDAGDSGIVGDEERVKHGIMGDEERVKPTEERVKHGIMGDEERVKPTGEGIVPTPSIQTALPQQEQPSRRSTRQSKKPVRFVESMNTTANDNLSFEQSYIECPKDTVAAVKKELQQMLDLQVFKPCPNSVEKFGKPLPSKMFLKRKSDGRLKCRLVIGGHLQHVIGETYSPTVNTESVIILFAISAKERRRLSTLDISGAFLHVKLPEEAKVLMTLKGKQAEMLVAMDNRYKLINGMVTVLVEKAIYGLATSSKAWNEDLDLKLKDFGFTRLNYDKCVYVKEGAILTLHVDDLLICDKTDHLTEDLEKHLTKHYGKAKLTTGKEFTYLGIHCKATPAGWRLSQKALISELELNKEQKGLALWERGIANGKRVDPTRFRSRLMKCMFLATRTRFDILPIVNRLATSQVGPSERDDSLLDQLVFYLKGTIDFELVIEPTNLDLCGFSDATFRSHGDGKSHSGCMVQLGGATIWAKSGKQRLITKSSAEAELVALNTVTEQVVYLRNLMEEMGFPLMKPTKIFIDSRSAVLMSLRGELGTKRTKHFTVRHYYVTGIMKEGKVTPVHVPREGNMSDGLTKMLFGKQQVRFAQAILGTKNRRGVLEENYRTDTFHRLAQNNTTIQEGNSGVVMDFWNK